MKPSQTIPAANNHFIKSAKCLAIVTCFMVLLNFNHLHGESGFIVGTSDAAFTAYASSQYGSMNVVTDTPNYHYSRTNDGSAGWANRNTLQANGWTQNWSDVPDYLSNYPSDTIVEMMVANTATMYGTTGGLAGTAGVAAGWTISVNFKLNPGASTSQRHALIGSYFYNSTASNPLFAPHNFYLEYSGSANVFDLKSGTHGYENYTYGQVTAGEFVNFTITRNTGNANIQSYINGVAGNTGTAAFLGTAGLIARTTTDDKDYLGLNYVLPSLGSATTDFVDAASVDVEGTTLYKLSHSERVMVGIELNRDNGTTRHFEGQITSIASMDGSLNATQVQNLYQSTQIPESKYYSLIFGLGILVLLSAIRPKFQQAFPL
jgi:hypothetical protein